MCPINIVLLFAFLLGVAILMASSVCEMTLSDLGRQF